MWIRERPVGLYPRRHGNGDLYALFSLLGEGVQAYRLTGSGYTPGTIYLPNQAGLESKVFAAAKKFGVNFHRR